jgi:hypothetical protein
MMTVYGARRLPTKERKVEVIKTDKSHIAHPAQPSGAIKLVQFPAFFTVFRVQGPVQLLMVAQVLTL